MLRDFLAKNFRAINSGLVDVRQPLLFRMLKGTQWISRFGYRYFKYPKSEKIIVRNFDHDIVVQLDPSKPIGGAIYWTGFHEFRELIFLHRYLTEDMVLVDVGANLGEFTLFAAKRLRKGKVLAYEPLPEMVEQLNESVHLNYFKNVMVIGAGLGDKPKSLPLYTPASKNNNEGLATLFPESAAVPSIMIEIRTLDDEFKRLAIDRLDVITMDIEGGELPALQGARNTLMKCKPIVILEINEKTFRSAGYSNSMVMDFFSDLRYAAFHLDKKGGLQPASALPQFGNVIFKSI